MGERSTGGLAAAAVAAAVTLVWNGHGLGETPRAAAADPRSGVTAVRGAGSCSATACHGGVRPTAGKVLRDEYTVWATRDRHSDAFRVLTEERSRAIAARLSSGRTPADRDPRCLACHAPTVPLPPPASRAFLLSDGVGCESCHGPSDRWIVDHTRRDWPGQGPETEARFGMVETVDLVRRARVCVGCHVGEPARGGLPARDVDHDLIAAGHPRLNFEFSAYLANMTHHWRDDVGRDNSADFGARSWAVGQLVTAKAALDLLIDRTRRAEPAGGALAGAPWPEFTEYACFSCHHDLRDEEWRRPAGDDLRRLGRNRWGTWHFPLIKTLAIADPSPEAQTVVAELAALRVLMAAGHPEPAAVARQAKLVSEPLGRWLDRPSVREFNAARLAALYSQVASLPDRGAVRSWDEATQRYLALVPLSQALRLLGAGPDRTKELTQLRDRLNYRNGYDSPKPFDPSKPPAP